MVLLVMVFVANAQNGDGTIMGYVYGSDSTKAVPFAKVWIDYNGSVLGVVTDLNGKYKISAVKPGEYNLHGEALLEGKKSMTGIVVYSESITKLDVYLPGNMLKEIDVPAKPLLQAENINNISRELIKKNINIQDPVRMISDIISDIQVDQNNQMIIRGSRPGDVVYFVDGVKQTEMQQVPGVAINSITVYTGGIPAKYGDTTGGVVILNTKSYFDLYYAWKAQQ